MMINQLLFISQPPCHGKTSNKEVFFVFGMGWSTRPNLDAIRVPGSAFSFVLLLAFMVGIFFVNASHNQQIRTHRQPAKVRICWFYLSIRVECETSLMQFSIFGIIKSVITVDNRMVVSYNELCKPQEGKSYANT